MKTWDIKIEWLDSAKAVESVSVTAWSQYNDILTIILAGTDRRIINLTKVAEVTVTERKNEREIEMNANSLSGAILRLSLAALFLSLALQIGAVGWPTPVTIGSSIGILNSDKPKPPDAASLMWGRSTAGLFTIDNSTGDLVSRRECTESLVRLATDIGGVYHLAIWSNADARTASTIEADLVRRLDKLKEENER